MQLKNSLFSVFSAIGKAHDAITKANTYADIIKKFESFDAAAPTAATDANTAFTDAVNTIKSSFGTYNVRENLIVIIRPC